MDRLMTLTAAGSSYLFSLLMIIIIQSNLLLFQCCVGQQLTNYKRLLCCTPRFPRMLNTMTPTVKYHKLPLTSLTCNPATNILLLS